jgi:predicted permease
MSWLSRFKNALNPRHLDEDLAAEIADHLERRAAALNEKGASAEEARRQARVRFGNTTRLREESRGIRLWTSVEGMLQDVRHAWRGMRKGPAFAVTATLSLALAIGANTATYSIVDAAILRPLPVPEPERLLLLSWPDIADPGLPAGQERESFSYPEYLRFAEVVRPAAHLVLASSPLRVEAQGPNPEAPLEKVNKAYISGDGFDVLGIRPAAGHLFSADDDRIPPSRAVAVLSYEYWHRRFGTDPDVIGRYLKVEGKSYEIAGVAREGFFGVEPGKFVDVWLPATQYERQALTELGWHWFRILGRIGAGASPQQIQARLQPSFHDFRVQSISQFRTIPEAIRKQFLKSVIHARFAPNGVSDLRKTFSRPLWIVFGVASGILLIACANVASLLLARSTARAAEMAMRVSLGAGRARLIRQMLTESLLLSLMAGGLGWLLARSIAPSLVHLLSTANDPAQFVLAIDTRVLLFCIAVSTASAVLFGLVPAWQASGVQPMLSLRASGGHARRLKLGKAFVSVQVACAFCLVLVGAAFLFSLIHLLRVDPGFEARNVAVLNVTTEATPISGDPVAWAATHPGDAERLRNLMFQIQNGVAHQPGIKAAAVVWWPIFEGGGWSSQVIIPGQGPSEQEEILYRVSPGYFATLRTPLLAGRDFQPADTGAREPEPVIVNEAFARKYFGNANALDREFSRPFGRSTIRQVIVGIASDAHYYDLRKPADPIVYLPLEANNGCTLYVRSTLNLGSLTRLVEREVLAAGAGTRVREVTTMDAIVGNTLLREKLLAGVGGIFASFGLLLAAIGLFGLLSYSVGRRTREIGIRTALGARRSEIISLVLLDVTALMSAGLAIGLAAALAIMALFRSLLFGIQKADPIVIGTAIGLFLLAGLVAACVPAHRAATIDPVSALREV